ncbi:MAG TPA: hypothetical protein VFD27_16385, partial [Chthoniobacteraceae bacterium]|nr:hypothetical protein [Chthoniobacteraceae bacterium]
MSIAALGGAILLLSWWVRDPSIPYGALTARASGKSADSSRNSEADNRTAAALDALARRVSAEHRSLARLAASALAGPADPESAFDYLKSLGTGDESGIVLADASGPQAWSGQLRNTPVVTAPGTSILVSPFYITLQVVNVRNGRTAIASSVLHAEPPADRIADALDEQIEERNLVQGFRFATLSDTTARRVINGGDGRPLLRVEAIPMPGEMVRFGERAASRARGAAVLGILIAILIAIGWSDRRALGLRLFTLLIALAAIALVPWNNFSNFSRAFDPAYFYSPAAGPFTTSAGPFAMASVVLLLAVIALIRSRPARIPRIAAGIVGVLLLVLGAVATERIARGIVLPPWGATASLWITWEIPLFVFLFAIFLASAWLLRITIGRRPMVELGTAAAIAFFCAAMSTFVVWTKTTEQRLQLAMRDVAGLERPDTDAAQLLARFGSQLSSYDSPGTRADILKRYAESDLVAAGLQASLGSSTTTGNQVIRLDLAQLT